MTTRLWIPLLALCLGTALEAQQRAPRRPRLPAEADTNDAAAYFQLGLDRLERDPGTAEAAFYWAARLDPMSPQSLYARGVALHLRVPARLVRWFQRDERTLGNPDVRTIDSLRYKAEMQDPFLHRGLDHLMLFAYAKSSTHNEEWFGSSSNAGASAVSAASRPGTSASANSGISGATESFLEQNDPFLRAVLWYSQGELRNAQQYLAIAVRARDVDFVWAERARVWAEMRQLDSATIALQGALALHRGAPSDDLTRPLYESSAAWEFALGRILEDRRDTARARAAYTRSIAADPGYYPAALRLGLMALQNRDTTGGRAVFRQVIARADVQFFACAVSATILDRAGFKPDALAALRRATVVEPLASAGWLMLARALETSADTSAASAYEKYLALAPRNDAARANATQAIARLRGTAP